MPNKIIFTGIPSSIQRVLIGMILIYSLLPFSLSWEWKGHQIMLPVEPFLVGIAIYLGWYFIRGKLLREHIYLHAPLTYWSLAHVLLMALSISWSVFPLVSLKYAVIESLHWVVYYFGVIFLVGTISKTSTDLSAFERVIKLLLVPYLFSFLVVIIYAWSRHAAYDFSIDTSVLVARPFYFDHALYGSCAALLLGPVSWLFLRQRIMCWKILYALAALVLLMCIFLSFSRAVWLSMVLAGGLTFIHWYWRPSLQRLLVVGIGGCCIVLLSFPLWRQVILNNRAESNEGTLTEQLTSMANLTTDVSNLERLNRYSCAWRMFLDCPFTGYGAGTFPMAYLPYQRPQEMTRISVFHTGPHPPGRGGGAHSEYLQALSERGFGGLLIWLGLLATTFSTIAKLPPGPTQQLALALFFSLSTFMLHGLFNNMLHHGKLAALFWGLLAILGYISCTQRKPV